MFGSDRSFSYRWRRLARIASIVECGRKQDGADLFVCPRGIVGHLDHANAAAAEIDPLRIRKIRASTFDLFHRSKRALEDAEPEV